MHRDITKHDALELEAETFSKSERRCHRMHDLFGFWLLDRNQAASGQKPASAMVPKAMYLDSKGEI